MAVPSFLSSLLYMGRVGLVSTFVLDTGRGGKAEWGLKQLHPP